MRLRERRDEVEEWMLRRAEKPTPVPLFEMVGPMSLAVVLAIVTPNTSLVRGAAR